MSSESGIRAEESTEKYNARKKRSPGRVEEQQATFDVIPCEKVIGRTEGRTYHVTGSGAPLGYFVKFHEVLPASSWDRTNEPGNTVYDRNSEEDVIVKVAMTPITAIKEGRKVGEGDVDDFDHDDTHKFRGRADVFFDPEMSRIPEDPTWYVAED